MKRKTNRLANPTLMCVFVHSWSLHEANTSPNKKYCQQGEWKENHVMFRASPFRYAIQRPIRLHTVYSCSPFEMRTNEQHVARQQQQQKKMNRRKISWKNSLIRTQKYTFKIFSYETQIDTHTRRKKEISYSLSDIAIFFLIRVVLFLALFLKWNETKLIFSSALILLLLFCFCDLFRFFFSTVCYAPPCKLYIALMNSLFLVFHVTKTNSMFYFSCYSAIRNSRVCVDLALIRIIWSNLRQWFRNNVSGNA